MKKNLFILICLISNLAKSQDDLFLPIDSSGYFKLISETGKSKTNWVELQDVKCLPWQDLIYAKSRGKWGVVDTSLSFVIFPKYDTIYKKSSWLFAESVGRLDIYTESFTLYKSILDFERIESIDFSKYESVIKSKYIIHTYDFAYIADHNFVYDSSLVYDDAFYMEGIIFTRKLDRYGFVSLSDSVIYPIYTSIGFFNKQVVELTDENNHRNYFYTYGEKIPDTDSTLQFELKTRLFKIYKNGKGHIYNEALELITNYDGEDVFCLYQPMSYPKDKSQYLFAFKKNGMIGVMHNNGSVLIQPVYEYVEYAFDNRFIVMLDGKFGVIDQLSNWIIEPKYTYIDNPHKSYFRIYDFSKKGLTDENGKIIVPIEFSEVYSSLSGIVTLNENGHGYYNFEGKEILTNEWSKVYQKPNSCFEFVQSVNHCLVNQNGLLTPRNCEKIYVDFNTVKYYLPDKIVISHIENGSLTDSTFFDRKPSVIISNNFIKNSLNVEDSDFEEFHSQLNGKIGSIRKEGDGFAVEPMFDNVLHDYLSTLVNQVYETEIMIGDFSIHSKEKLQQFYGKNGSTGDKYFAYLGGRSSSVWHSTTLDPVITTDLFFQFSNHNYLSSASNEFMMSRKEFTSVSLSSGDVNLIEGQNVIDYRTYYSQLNSYNNLVINNPQEFSLLSRSPMIKVTDPSWHVIEILDDYKIKLVGDFDYYNELETGMAIFSTTGVEYGIYFIRASNIANEEFTSIIPFTENEMQYFYMGKFISDQGDISELKWTIFNYRGAVLPAYYSAVECIHSGYYIISQNGNRSVIDTAGVVIYKFL